MRLHRGHRAKLDTPFLISGSVAFCHSEEEGCAGFRDGLEVERVSLGARLGDYRHG